MLHWPPHRHDLKLKPTIAATGAQELETQHADKKAAYDAAVGALEARVAALEEETGSMSREVTEGEAKASALTDMLSKLDTNLKRVATAASAERLREQ